MSYTPFYTLIQSLYWSTYCLMFSFASLFLQSRGCSNSVIGIVLGCTYALSSLLQPAYASVTDRFGISLPRSMLPIYAMIAVMAVCMLLPISGIVLTVIFVLMLTLQCSMQPYINSLAEHFRRLGGKVDFGTARGIGSGAYAVVSILCGQLFTVLPVRWIPALYLGMVIVLILMLASIDPGKPIAVGAKGSYVGTRDILRVRCFSVFLVGIAFLAAAHIVVDSFMLQILQRVGGDSGSLGLALGLAAATEVPAMILYSRLRKRFGISAMLCLFSFGWVTKIGCIAVAPTPLAVCCAQLLQFISYAMYVTASVDYVSVVLPAEAYVRGQAFVLTAFTIGSLLATLAGGVLLDTLGVQPVAFLATALSAIGAVLMLVCTRLRQEPAH